MTKQEAYKVFKTDNEMHSIPHHDDSGSDDIGLKLKHIVKSDLNCPLCKKRVWRVSLDFDTQPEWTYYCDKCKKRFYIIQIKEKEK